jgi:hypothetical protein
MRRTLTALVITSLAVSLTGCGAGTTASTREVRQVTDGVEGSITKDGNDIKVVNLLVVAAAGGNAVLVGTVVNNSDKEDALLGVAINGTAATLTGNNVLPKNSPIIFEGPSANAKAVLGGFGAPAGSRVQVGLFFAHAGVLTLDAIVRDTRDTYAGVTAGATLVKASPSPSATAKK